MHPSIPRTVELRDFVLEDQPRQPHEGILKGGKVLQSMIQLETTMQLLRRALFEVCGVHRVDAVAEAVGRDVVQRDAAEGAPDVRLLSRLTTSSDDGTELVQLLRRT